MSNTKRETCNKQVQTTIRCFPHVLTSRDDSAQVLSERGCQTAASTNPHTNNFDFYRSLEFVPYQIIAEGSIREVDLPRRAILHWNLQSSSSSVATKAVSSHTTKSIDYYDHHQKGVLKKSTSKIRASSSAIRHTLAHHHTAMQKTMVDAEVQTTLSVAPHVLETDEVANVFTEISIQTSITCLPNDSITNILPQLKANLSHSTGCNASISAAAEKTPEVVQASDEAAAEEPGDSELLGANATADITLSTSQRTSSQGCQCSVLTKIAGQLRVQATTLKLTPTVFPPGVQFEERIMAVLNTTISVLQSEMANLMDVYVEDVDLNCACGKIKKIEKPRRSCSCSGKSELTAPNTESNVDSLEDEALAVDQNNLPQEAEEAQTADAPPGDSLAKKSSIFIPCECHPTQAGAAPPALAPSRSSILSCTCPGNAPVANKMSGTDRTLKFQFVMKKSISHVESSTAESAIVVRTTFSYPDTNKMSAENVCKTGSENVQTGQSMPDLSEQVIRLSVIYKDGSPEPETKIEELSRSGRPLNAAEFCECGRPICIKGSSQMPSNSLPSGGASAKACPCSSEKESSAPGASVSFSKQSSMSRPSSTLAESKIPEPCPCSSPSRSNVSSPSRTKQSKIPVRASTTKGNVKITVSVREQPSSNKVCQTPYVEDFLGGDVDRSTGVQTNIALGDRLQSESLNSVGGDEGDDGECAGKIKINLPPKGSCNIEPMEKQQRTINLEEMEEREPVLDRNKVKYNDNANIEKKCVCTGMFNTTSRAERCEDFGDTIIDIHMGFKEPVSSIMQVEQRAAAFPTTVSVCSTISSNLKVPKRCAKQFTFHIDLSKSSNFSVSFQGKERLPGTSSVIVSIKPSTECSYSSRKFPIADERASDVLNVINPPTYLGNYPTSTRSCTTSNMSRPSGRICPKSSSSMPAVSSQRNVQATVSIRKAGAEDGRVISRMAMNQGENVMTVKVANAPITVTLKVSTAQAGGGSEEAEVFQPANCSCKNKIKPDTFRQDPVVAALEAYEAEMKPIKRALTELQQKIRNLDMPEMKGCFCKVALNKLLSDDSIIRSTAEIGTSPRTSAQYETMGSYGTCPSYQPPGFVAPIVPLPYGRLPPPVLSSRPQTDKGGHRSKSCKCGCSKCSKKATPRVFCTDSGKPPKSKKHHHKDKGCCKDYSSPYGRNNIVLPTRPYEMFPNYRSRTYVNEDSTYKSAFLSNTHKEASYHFCGIKSVSSYQSSTSEISDYGDYTTQSEREEVYRKKSCKTHKKKCKKTERIPSKDSSKLNSFDSCLPCRDSFNETLLRPGQALKIKPDEFISNVLIKTDSSHLSQFSTSMGYSEIRRLHKS